MPRRDRLASESGLYHATMRGVGQQRLFEEDEDYREFLFLMGDVGDLTGVHVLAYCLMTNHVHLLIDLGPAEIATFFRRLSIRYATWFNKKYERSGHLFQGRYRSDPVDDELYLAAAVAYIHLNPVKAGLVEKPEDYPWSSRLAFGGVADGITDLDRLRHYIAPEACVSAETSGLPEPPGLSAIPARGRPPRYTDSQACAFLKEASGCATTAEWQALPRERQHATVLDLLGRRVPVRQAARITGLPKGVVQRWSQERRA
ncbi:MAG: transposase [Propionibacteriaceae bacterium]|jgi:REP element-mobilizing transposase RayT|nr:transposase [Propionibacteriaceae bacterium]